MPHFVNLWRKREKIISAVPALWSVQRHKTRSEGESRGVLWAFLQRTLVEPLATPSRESGGLCLLSSRSGPGWRVLHAWSRRWVCPQLALETWGRGREQMQKAVPWPPPRRLGQYRRALVRPRKHPGRRDDTNQTVLLCGSVKGLLKTQGREVSPTSGRWVEEQEESADHPGKHLWLLSCQRAQTSGFLGCFPQPSTWQGLGSGRQPAQERRWAKTESLPDTTTLLCQDLE